MYLNLVLLATAVSAQARLADCFVLSNWLGLKIVPLNPKNCNNSVLNGQSFVKLNAAGRVVRLNIDSLPNETQIPPSIGKLTELTHLDITSPKISGPLTSEIGRLVNLEWLQIIQTNLNGTIPSEITSLKSLKNLYIKDNDFSGKIPDFRNLKTNFGKVPSFLTCELIRLGTDPSLCVLPGGFFPDGCAYETTYPVCIEKSTSQVVGVPANNDMPVGSGGLPMTTIIAISVSAGLIVFCSLMGFFIRRRKTSRKIKNIVVSKNDNFDSKSSEVTLNLSQKKYQQDQDRPYDQQMMHNNQDFYPQHQQQQPSFPFALPLNKYPYTLNQGGATFPENPPFAVITQPHSIPYNTPVIPYN